MDTSNSSTTSSQHYSVLLTTVADLRNDLEKAVTKIQSLEEQNQELSDNYQVVKNELISTRAKYSEARESYLRTVSEKFDAEKQHEAFMDRLKEQLVQKTKEFEVIREKLVPHDIDQLRIKVQEELEIQHKAQLQALESQIEAERGQFFSSKREYERGKVEYEVLIQHQQHEIQALRTEREEVEVDLRDQILKLRDVEYTPSKDERMRALKAKINELSHLTELLREEAKSARQERDEAVYELEQARSSHEQAQVYLKSRLASAEADQRGMEERVSRYSAESERKEASLRSSRQSVEDLTEKLEFTTKQVSDAEKQIAAMKEEHAKQIELLQSTIDIERLDLQERYDTVSDRLAEKEEEVRRLQREGNDAAVRAESSEAELRRSHQLQLQDARRKHTAVEVELAEANATLKTTSAEALQAAESNKHEIECLRSEVSKLKRDKDMIQHKTRELELTADADKRKLHVTQQEYTSKLRILESQVREAESKSSASESKLAASREQLFELTSAYQSTKDTNMRLEQRLQEQTQVADAMKREFQAQVESLGPSFQHQAEALKKKLRVALSKEKKRAAAYKNKALEAHTRAKENMNIIEHWKLTEAMNPRYGTTSTIAAVAAGGGGGATINSDGGYSTDTAMLNAAILNAPISGLPMAASTVAGSGEQVAATN